MAESCGGWYWRLGSASFVAVGGAIAFSGDCAIAQVTPDGTLGAESSVVTPTNVNGLPGDVIDGGATRGANLFHSFEQFSIPTGGEASFNNALDIQNIISRVTGSSISNIDGLLRANGAANLFLLNPNGINFGSNAQLSIGGSFVGSTSSSLNFADGTQFSATAPTTTPLLTVSVPVGLQYGGTAGSILSRSRATNSSGGLVGLQVQPGNTLMLMGGDVRLDGGILFTPGGRVELGGVVGAGTVGLNVDGNNLSLSYPASVQRADVSLTNGARVYVAAGDGGSIAVNARSLDVLGGTNLTAGIRSGQGSVGSQAGDIGIDATGAVTVAGSTIFNIVESGAVGNSGGINITTGSLGVRNGAQLGAFTRGQGDAGSVNINVRDTASFDGGSVVSNVDEPTAIGKAGNIDITTGSLAVTNSGFLGAFTRGQGDAGSVNINARDTASFDGGSAFSTVESGAVGNGGGINVTTGSLTVRNGAQLGAFTRGQGDAGSVNINVRDTASFDGGSVVSNVDEPTAIGMAGNIDITTGSLAVTNSGFLGAFTRGQGDAGSVNINARDTASFDGGSAFSTVESGAVGNGSSINVTTGLLTVRNGAQLGAFTRGQGDAGSVNINARDTASFDGGSAVSTVEPGAVGNGGGINVKTGSLSLANGAQLLGSTRGRGDAGSVTIEASDNISFDGVGNTGGASGASSSVASGAVGNGGNIDITTGSLAVRNGAQLGAFTRGQGDAGSVNINARDTASFDGGSAVSNVDEPTAIGKAGNIDITTGLLAVTNGGFLGTFTRGQGDAGSVNINARDTASFDGGSAFSTVESGAVGNGGGINVTTGSLTVRNGAQLSAFTRGQGDAGSVNINVRDTASFDGASVVSNVDEPTAIGEAGNIDITTGSLAVTNSGFLGAFTRGQGDAGSVNINARDTASFDGGSAFSTVESGAVGNGGGINVTTGSLTVRNGAQLGAFTRGQGDAGSVNINVRDTASFDGGSVVSNVDEPTAIGKAGNIDITTGSLAVTNSGFLGAFTRGQGDAGSVNINARDTASFDGGSAFSTVESGAVGNGGGINVTTGSLTVRNGAQLGAFTRGQGDAGSVNINARDTASFDGGSAFSTVEPGAVGNGGGVNITTGSLSVTDGARLTASSAGSGAAGNIEVTADSIRLDNQAALNADTTAGQGNIFLSSRDLVLRRGSNITTNATGTASGGNINIDSDVIAAFENSDISADSANSLGGRVTVNAQGIFGTEFRNQRTPLSDITATGGSPELSGRVEINNPDVDPSQGLVELPAELVDVSNQIAQGCSAGVRSGETKFVITGRGGLPPNPNDPLTGDNVLTEWNTLDSDTENRSSATPATNSAKESAPTQIVEVNGWMTNDKGEVILTASAPTATLNIPWVPNSDCNAPGQKS